MGHVLSDARPQVPAQQFWYTAREKGAEGENGVGGEQLAEY